MDVLSESPTYTLLPETTYCKVVAISVKLGLLPFPLYIDCPTAPVRFD